MHGIFILRPAYDQINKLLKHFKQWPRPGMIANTPGENQRPDMIANTPGEIQGPDMIVNTQSKLAALIGFRRKC